MVLDILYGFVLLIVILVASGVTVSVFEKIVHKIKINKILLAAILVGFTTSLPELFLGVGAAMRGIPQVALGNLIGANIANMSWVIGTAALIAGTVPVVGQYLRKELWITMVAATAPFLLMSDGLLSSLDGGILIILYFLYVRDLVLSNNHPLKHMHMSGKIQAVHHSVKHKINWTKEVVLLIASVSALGAGSWLLLGFVTKVAVTMNVSYFWIGLIVVALGTTIPEVALSIGAAKRKEVSLVLANIFGSVVVNSTLILGIIAIISPVSYIETLPRGLSGLFLIVILSLFWLFTKSKYKLDKWEGLALIGLYIMFAGLQIFLA